MTTDKDTKKRAVVLLSGGLDSATVAACLMAEGFRVHALTIDYGQRHKIEVDYATDMAESLGVYEHVIMPLSLPFSDASALTNVSIEVPKGSDCEEPVEKNIPITYVPARNTIFLSVALGFAESRQTQVIGIGVNALDYSGYPDCRPEYISLFEKVANLGTKLGAQGDSFRFFAPLQHLSKAEILRKAIDLRVPIEKTISCYDPTSDGLACGLCDSCRLRMQAQKEVENNV